MSLHFNPSIWAEKAGFASKREPHLKALQFIARSLTATYIYCVSVTCSPSTFVQVTKETIPFSLPTQWQVISQSMETNSFLMVCVKHFNDGSPSWIIREVSRWRKHICTKILVLVCSSILSWLYVGACTCMYIYSKHWEIHTGIKDGFPGRILLLADEVFFSCPP